MSVLVFSLGRVCQLLAAGVDVNLRDSPETQSTPLHWAASYGNKDIVQCLCCEFKGMGGGGGAGVDVSHFVVIYITPVREMSSAITGLCCR